MNVDIPMDIELVEPLQESCIWCQARGAATEISGMDEVPGSLYKVLLQIETFLAKQSDYVLSNLMSSWYRLVLHNSGMMN